MYQPGAADLLDQIQMAKKVLGIEAGMFANAPIFLEIVFKGYEDDIDDPEAAGAPVKIQGPWCWQLEIATVDVAITEDGSTYDFSVVIGSDSAFSDSYYTIPADTSMTGATIKECMEDLEETLTKYREDRPLSQLVLFNRRQTGLPPTGWRTGSEHASRCGSCDTGPYRNSQPHLARCCLGECGWTGPRI